MEANIITSEVEEEDSTTCTNARMTKLDDEDKNTMPKTPSLEHAMMNEEKEGKELMTLKTKIGSNDVSNTLRKFGFAQYV